MNQPPQTQDLDKFAIIPARLDDFRRLWKLLRASLTESFNTFNHFGKSLNKASRNLQYSFNPEDPSFICQLTLLLLTRQAKTSQALSQLLDDSVQLAFKDLDSYEGNLEQIRVQASEMITEGLKQLTLTRTNYAREKANYEKICKETDMAISERKRTVTDPLIFYNLNHKKKLKQKVVESLRALKLAESQVQEAIELYNARQTAMNAILSKSIGTFKESLGLLLKNMVDIVKKHNKVLVDFLQNEMVDFEKSGIQTTVESHTLSTEDSEQQYLELRKQKMIEQQQIPDQNNAAQAVVSSTKYSDLKVRLEQDHSLVTDQEIYEFADLVQKHYDTTVSVFDERFKVIKGLKAYLQDLNSLCIFVEKAFQKLSKSFLAQSCLTTIGKRAAGTVDPLFGGFGAFGSIFQQFGSFVNMNLPLLDGMMNEQKDSVKAFQNSFAKSVKGYFQAKTATVSTNLQFDKYVREIAELTEKDPNSEKLVALKTEFETVKKTKEDQIAEMKKQATEALDGITKTYAEYRGKEQSKHEDFNNLVKGIIVQEYVFYKGFSETLNGNVGNNLRSEEAADGDSMQFIEQDEAMASYVPYLKNEAEKSPILKDVKLAFNKMYTPPEDVVAEIEAEKNASGQEEEQQAGEDENMEVRFGLKKSEKPLDDFTCGVEQGILRQGRMYLYPNVLCFSTSKILGDIALVVPIEDITRIEKKTMSLVFDTALSIITKRGEIKFLSFFSRDKAYNTIVSIMKEASVQRKAANGGSAGATPDKQMMIKSAVKPQEDQTIKLEEQAVPKKNEEVLLETLNKPAPQDGVANDSPVKGTSIIEKLEEKGEATATEEVVQEEESAPEDKAKEEEELNEKKKLLETIQARKERLRGGLFPDDKYTLLMAEEILQCSALDVYMAVFSDKPVTLRGKAYDNFWMALKVASSDTEIKYAKWAGQSPYEVLYGEKEDLEMLKKIAGGVEKSVRNFVYVHPVREGGPFVPKNCCVEEKHTGFWLGEDEFVMQNEVYTSKVPMSDCFVVRNNFKVKEMGDGKCHFKWTFGVEFVKSTMFRGRIEKSSREESGQFAAKIFVPLMKENLALYLAEKSREVQKKQALKAAAQMAKIKKAASCPPSGVGEAGGNEAASEAKPEAVAAVVEEVKVEEVKVQEVVQEEVKVEGGFREEFARFVKASENEREGLKSEIKGLKNLIFALIAMNALLFLYTMYKH